MKKIWILALLAVVAISASAENTVMKAFKTDKEYTAIGVGGPINVIVEERTEGNIIIRATEKILSVIELKVEDGSLNISFPKGFEVKRWSDLVQAEVYIPYNGKLREFGAVGCARIEVKPQITVKDVEVECAAASRIELTKVTADKISIDAVGAGKVSLAVECTSLEMDVTGASTVTISGKATKCEADVAGASTLNAENLHCSQLETEVAGASSADLSADMAEVEVSGASSADIACTTQLTASAAGASTVRYSDDCQVNIRNNSGASTIKKK